MSITRLSGGLSPANGSDPRTFPTIWNETANDIEALETSLAALGLNDLTDVVITSPVTGQVLKYNGTNWIADVVATNTDGDPGGQIYVGVTDPSGAFTLAAGDVWIEVPE